MPQASLDLCGLNGEKAFIYLGCLIMKRQQCLTKHTQTLTLTHTPATQIETDLQTWLQKQV